MHSPYVTNAMGIVEVELPDGTYTYTASLDGYIPAQGTAVINGSNATENMMLPPVLYTVTFVVDSNTGPLGGAEIQINGDTLITNRWHSHHPACRW
ncbi:hypothetical protein MASR1M74_19320 [Lentimicrobium sp.]